MITRDLILIMYDVTFCNDLMLVNGRRSRVLKIVNAALIMYLWLFRL